MVAYLGCLPGKIIPFFLCKGVVGFLGWLPAKMGWKFAVFPFPFLKQIIFIHHDARNSKIRIELKLIERMYTSNVY